MVDRNRFEAACRGDEWLRSRRMQCVGFDWSVLANEAALVDRVTYLYAACVAGTAGPPTHEFILRRHASSNAMSVSLYRDGRAILRRVPPGLAIARLVWEVNRGVVEEAGSRLLLHAAAAARDGRIVLLAGPEGSGKSTLVTALVRSGLRYVTDETVAVDVPGTKIVPYPKPIALDCRSLDVVDGEHPAAPSPLEEGSDQRLMPPQAIRRDAIAQPGGVARLLVLPSYRPGQQTATRPLPRPEAAVALAEQAFNFRQFGRGRLDAVAEVVRGCECYRLEVGDAAAARDVVLDLLEHGG
jgi:hypothetical protein